jgi:large subunit ribosomal protein L3
MNIDALIGIKGTQNQQFTAEGKRIPVTEISTASLFVVGVKTSEKDGYNAVQLGIGTRRLSTLTRPEQEHIKKAGLEKTPPRHLREIRMDTATSDDLKNFSPGTLLKASSVFNTGDVIEVTGTSKGKGFQGGVKRHHFKGGPRTHGQSDRERAPGSIGQTTTPGRVYKGKRMAGRMGNDTVTIKNLRIVSIDDEKNKLMVSGLIPGGKNGVLMIRKMKKH